jgi:DNA end-binding protein Ku
MKSPVVGDALVLEIMRFANELVDAKEFNFRPRDAVRPRELQMAEQLVANLAEPFDPARYTDDYRANLMRVIKAKMKGKKPRLEEPEGETPDSGVLDLMSRLRASLEEDNGKEGAVRAKRKSVAAGRKSAKSKKRQTA